MVGRISRSCRLYCSVVPGGRLCMLKRFCLMALAGCGFFLIASAELSAQGTNPPATAATTSAPASTTPAAPAKSPFETMTAGMKPVEGMWKLYHKDQQLLVELNSSQLNQ